jgi:transcriptional regulator
VELCRCACLWADRILDDADRLRKVVTRLTDVHERSGKDRWAVSDAPADFIKTELKGIVRLRLQTTRFDGTRKMSQNRNAADRAGVIEGLSRGYRRATVTKSVVWLTSLR